jgi:Xaa-Pro aminopeptidase
MKQKIIERIAAIREIMHHENLDAFYISGTDPHMSEYLCDYWQTRKFFTGFTGSFGEMLITRESAGLWTDTRYFIQAEEQLAGTSISMHKLRVPEAIPVSKWLKLNIQAGCRIGVDPLSLPLATYRLFREELDSLNIEIVFLPDAINEVWANRPPLPQKPVFEHPEIQAGESRQGKIQRIISEIENVGATLTIISALDDLAWAFNLRGSDVVYNPVFMGFGILGKQYRMLFVHKPALSEKLLIQLTGEGIKVLEYEEFYGFIKSLHDETILVDPSTFNSGAWLAINKKNRLIENTSVPALLKAVKNDIELNGFRAAMRNDGAALVAFLFWLKENIGKIPITEYSVGVELAKFRSGPPCFKGESFSPIVGYSDHGAIVHLSVDETNAHELKPQGLLLFDSGGQYSSGTTDVTRTVALGPVTGQQKRDFTLVLKGMIRLSMAVFPAGTKGVHLDILARQALWENGLNYGHGTGHGVGHFLCVHEGPASIRQEYNPHEIKPGMVFSNEPGLYRTGEYGIRTENMMVCVEKETTEFGRFLGFETLTVCPIDTSLVVKELLLPAELGWLNSYHQKVRSELQPVIKGKLKDFLIKITAEI